MKFKQVIAFKAIKHRHLITNFSLNNNIFMNSLNVLLL